MLVRPFAVVVLAAMTAGCFQGKPGEADTIEAWTDWEEGRLQVHILFLDGDRQTSCDCDVRILLNDSEVGSWSIESSQFHDDPGVFGRKVWSVRLDEGTVPPCGGFTFTHSVVVEATLRNGAVLQDMVMSGCPA